MSFCTQDAQDQIINQRVAEVVMSILPKKASTEHTLRLSELLRADAILALGELASSRPTEDEVRCTVNKAVTKAKGNAHLKRVRRTKVEVRQTRPGRRAPASVRKRVDEFAQFGQVPCDVRRATA